MGRRQDTVRERNGTAVRWRGRGYDNAAARTDRMGSMLRMIGIFRYGGAGGASCSSAGRACVLLDPWCTTAPCCRHLTGAASRSRHGYQVLYYNCKVPGHKNLNAKRIHEQLLDLNGNDEPHARNH